MHSMYQSTLLRIMLFVWMLVGAVVSTPAASAKKDPPGLPNFHQVATGIYRGGAPTKEGMKKLLDMKIHTIIDLRIEKKPAAAEKKMAEGFGFTWINLRMGREAPTQQQVDTFLATLDKAEQEPVFVHCQHGADRTGCMIGIYRVQVQDWTFAQTWAEMRAYGFKPYLDDLKNAVKKRAPQ